LEPTLMVVGLNYRTAPVAVRERFWIDKSRRYDALVQLSGAEGVEEAVIVSTCIRTEFWLWTNDVTLAANSVMRLLGAEYGLQLCQWKHFYRLLDDAALQHVFRVVSGLDCMAVGAPQIVPQLKEAWQQAQQAGACGHFLDAVVQKALAVSERLRSETAIEKVPISIPFTALEFARQIFGTLENKKILLIGAGEMSELSAQGLVRQGGNSVRWTIVNRTFENAAELAAKLGGVALPFEQRTQPMAEADIIICSTACPHTILVRDEVENMVRGRKHRPLVILDLAMPRDVDPAVRNLEGVFLCDLDDLENVTDPNADEREAAAVEAQKILQAEVRGFRRKLLAERVVPTIVALRQRLDEICGKELDTFRLENGPFSKDQDEMLNAVLARMTQKIAGSLARELKESPEKVEQEQLTTALQRLFHLQTGIAEQASAAIRP
jgi:glutamyl-tRNA reductase